MDEVILWILWLALSLRLFWLERDLRRYIDRLYDVHWTLLMTQKALLNQGILITPEDEAHGGAPPWQQTGS